jgi:hypothetical protein
MPISKPRGIVYLAVPAPSGISWIATSASSGAGLDTLNNLSAVKSERGEEHFVWISCVSGSSLGRDQRLEKDI